VFDAGRGGGSIRPYGRCRIFAVIASGPKRKAGHQKLRFRNGKGVCTRSLRQQQLAAENLSVILDSMIKSSEGNPGAILRMIAMAKQSKYRSEDHIKWSPLYPGRRSCQ